MQDQRQIGPALAERSRAIVAIRRWIAAELGASRPVSADVAAQLTSDVERGSRVLLRMALAREVTRGDLMSVGRELQMLRSLAVVSTREPLSLDCRG
jgi:hypothetical protein